METKQRVLNNLKNAVNTNSVNKFSFRQALSFLSICLILFIYVQNSYGQVGIGTNDPDSTSILDLADTTKGVLIPRLTELQKDAISNPATGLLIFQTDNISGFYYNAGTPLAADWVRIATGEGSGWSLAGNAATNDTVDFLGTTDSAAVVFKTNNTEVLRINPDGGIGIGTSNPDGDIEIVSDGSVPKILLTGYRNSFSPGEFFGRKARGTFASPISVMNGDALAVFGGYGYTGTGFNDNGSCARMYFSASQDWSDSTLGADIYFRTTQNDSAFSYERMRIMNNGDIGIGTSTPDADVELVRDQGIPKFMATGYRETFSAGEFIGRKARGSFASPAAVATDDILAIFGSSGYGTSDWHHGPRIYLKAAQEWTDTTIGSYISIKTTQIDDSMAYERFRITDAGDIGIGTDAPYGSVELARDQGVASFTTTTYRETSYNSAKFTGRSARGTQAAPSATLLDDYLASFCGDGYGETGFSSSPPNGRVAFKAAENWSDTSQATYMIVGTTPVGDIYSTEYMRLTSDGMLGIGTSSPQVPLHIHRDLNNAEVGISSGDSSAKLVFESAVGMNNYIGFNNTLIFGRQAEIDSSFSSRMVLTDNGYLGIGTISPNSSLQVKDGDVYIETIGSGIILRDTDGTGCHRVTVDSGGALSVVAITCP